MMKIVDLHPEDLIDKDTRGALTDVERTRLEAHCAQCAACRAERQLRLDFADERSEDCIEDAHFSSELIAIALGSAKAKKPVVEEPAPAPETKTPSVRPAARPRRLARVWLLAAAAMLAVTAAAANQATSGSWVRRSVGIDTPAEIESLAAKAKAKASPATPATPVAAPIAPARAVPPAPVVVEEAPARVVVPFVTNAPAASPAPKAITAATMFDEANDARRKGDYARAVELHRQLQAKHPSSREAQVSRATLGRLLLDRGDLGSALESFDDYLAHGAHGAGELDEAVMVGRATALERLGRTGDARRAWQALLDAFPSSPYAEHARARTEQ